MGSDERDGSVLEEGSGSPATTDDDLDADEVAALEEPDPNPEPISYGGQDFDVEGLVRRLDRGDIVIPTFGHGDETLELSGFQRRFVWRRPQMDRFIESLLLGYPIPGIFLVQQADKRYLVLDGQQRLRTLSAFYGGEHNDRSFSLQNVADRLKGLSYKTLGEELRRLLDNTFIQATVVKTDGSTESLDAVYQVFERLNSGGTQLTPHEIRVALYAGPFIDFLTELNKWPTWRKLYGTEPLRLRDQELILRVIALYVSPETYKRPLKKYLNDFVASKRSLSGISTATVRERFHSATGLLDKGPGPSALRGRGRQVNAAFAEAVLVGLFRRLDRSPEPSHVKVREAVAELEGNSNLQEVVSRATADEENVRKRLALATKTFASI